MLKNGRKLFLEKKLFFCRATEFKFKKEASIPAAFGKGKVTQQRFALILPKSTLSVDYVII